MRIFWRERMFETAGFREGRMQHLRPKRPRLKLSVEEYTLLRRRVLERDRVAMSKLWFDEKTCTCII